MRIAVIGAGSAGVITAAQLCAGVPNNIQIVNIHDPNIPMFQIGESTNSGFIKVLEQACGFGFMEDMKEMDSTLKFGNNFIKWRETDWFNPLLDGGVSIHINNFKLREYVFNRLAKRWPKKFSIMQGRVTSIESLEKGVNLTVDGKIEHFAYVVDTQGTPADLSDYQIAEGISINSGIIHTVDEPGDWQYTEHLATKHGWMFGVPLQSRHTHGYLYNDTVTTREEALEDMATYFNTTPDKLGRKNAPVDYHFKSYYAKTVFDNNIMKNGNRAMFFEPISGTGIFGYIILNYFFLDYLWGRITKEDVNAQFLEHAEQLEHMICFFYHGGSMYDTPFWQLAKERSTKTLMNSVHFKKALEDCYKKGQDGLPHYSNGWVFSGYHLHLIDEKFGYNYFSDADKNKKTIEAINRNLNTDGRTIL
jgi:tryptophan halogenase